MNYSEMQENHFNNQAKMWSLEDKNKIVGSFDKHNNHADYEFLFKDIPDLKEKVMLDFGCGVGRNIVKYNDRFKRIDGVDISSVNLENTKIWCEHNGIENYKVFKCNGKDLNEIDSNSYDVVMSTITLQHIAIYEIRYSYFEEFYRVLRSGFLTFQMGFGRNDKLKNKYYDNNLNEKYTGGTKFSDVEISCPMQVINDLEIIGFTNCKYYIRHGVPGGYHKAAIFVNAEKIEGFK